MGWPWSTTSCKTPGCLIFAWNWGGFRQRNALKLQIKAACSPHVECRNATPLLFLFDLGNTDTGAPPTPGLFWFLSAAQCAKPCEFHCQRFSQGATTDPFMMRCWATCRPSPTPGFRWWSSWTACRTARRKPPRWKGVARRYGAPRLPVFSISPPRCLLVVSRKPPAVYRFYWRQRALVLSSTTLSFVLGMRRVSTLEGGVF